MSFLSKILTIWRFLGLLLLSSFDLKASNIAHHKPSIIVTCATGALGKAICEKLAPYYHLILLGRNCKTLTSLQTTLEQKYKTKAEILSFDYLDLESLKECLKKIEKPIHGLVLMTPRPFFSSKGIPSTQEWQKALQETFIGPVELMRLCAPKLQPTGSVVIVSGITSKVFLPQYPYTNVIRVMWSGLLKNLAFELGERGIRVNAVSPWVMLTPHNIQKIQDRAQKAKKPFQEQMKTESRVGALKRYGMPNEVASLISFLLSKESLYVSGENIALDGGFNTAY